ncbi:hypothetical protein GCM10029992_35650 [Glycomyces albus]
MNIDYWTVLRRDGVAVVLAHPEAGLPCMVHWGLDLGELGEADLAALERSTSRQTNPRTLDRPLRPPLVPQESDGWSGRPGLLATSDGRPVFPAGRPSPNPRARRPCS